jgi:hypothetical protein
MSEFCELLFPESFVASFLYNLCDLLCYESGAWQIINNLMFDV